MTREDKQLLLVDLSARLPYGVKMNHIADDKYQPDILIGVAKDMITLQNSSGYNTADVEDYKPYLFPLLSMTEEQKNVYHSFYADILRGLITPANSVKLVDWLNAHHFDFRNLISRGLAIDCTNLNIY